MAGGSKRFTGMKLGLRRGVVGAKLYPVGLPPTLRASSDRTTKGNSDVNVVGLAAFRTYFMALSTTIGFARLVHGSAWW
jgi:hypothetical protein